MLCKRAVAGPAAQAARAVPPSLPRRAVAVRARDPDTQVHAAVDSGLVNPTFANALSAALQRSGGDRALLDNASASIEEERGNPLKHVEEMLMTAIHTSRASVRGLVQRQSELEAEIAKEQKQAARLEWLLNRVRSDYSYFSALDSMAEERK